MRTAPDLETPYLRDGWAFLDDTVRPEAQWEYDAELAWDRMQLLTAISRLPAPDRDQLRAYLTIPVDLDVLAALFHTTERALWTVLVATTERLLRTLDPDLAALLPDSLLDAMAAETAA
jgi:hypothetical protein